MNKAMEEFNSANLLKKLSIIADIITIFGISVATLVGAPLFSEMLGQEFNLANFILAALFYSILICFGIAILVYFIKYTTNSWSSRDYRKVVFSFMACMLVMWLSALIFPYLRNSIGFISGNNYLLPPKAEVAVKEVQVSLKDSKANVGMLIEGKILFDIEIKNTDYVVVAYTKYKDAISYNLNRTDNAIAEIGSDGTFKIPNIPYRRVTVGNSLESVFLVVYRYLDFSFFGEYPDNIINLPNNDIDKYGGYVVPLNYSP